MPRNNERPKLVLVDRPSIHPVLLLETPLAHSRAHAKRKRRGGGCLPFTEKEKEKEKEKENGEKKEREKERKKRKEKRKKGKGESSRKRLKHNRRRHEPRCPFLVLCVHKCARLSREEKKKKGGAKKEIRERRRRKRGEGEKESERVREKKKGKNTNTHVHKYTYIFIYIHGELVTPGSPRPGLDNRDVFRAKNRPGTRVSPRSLALWLRLVGWLGCVRARAGHAEVNGALPRFFGPENVAAWVSAWIPRSMHSWLGGTVTFNRHVNR